MKPTTASAGAVKKEEIPFYEEIGWNPDLKDYPPYTITDMDDIPYMGPSIDRPRKRKNPIGPFNFGLDIKDERRKGKLSDKYLDTDKIWKWQQGLGKEVDGPSFCYKLFYARNRCLANVDVMQFFTGFAYVNFSHNRLTSILSLADLQYMRCLNLECNLIKNPANIPTFPNIHALTLMSNRLTHTRGFNPQPRLQYLNLSRNKITSVEGLNGKIFPNLKTLELRGNLLTSLQGLRFPKLHHLYVAQNQLTTMGDLVNCPMLISFHARANKIEDLANYPINLTSLMYLNLRENLVDHHTQIPRLGHSPLRAMVLTDCPISKGAKYRLETITSIICLVRLDKTRIVQADVSTAMYLRLQRFKGHLPQLRDEILALTPPPTPISDVDAQEHIINLMKVASELNHFPESLGYDLGFKTGVPSAADIPEARKFRKRSSQIAKGSRKLSLSEKERKDSISSNKSDKRKSQDERKNSDQSRKISLDSTGSTKVQKKKASLAEKDSTGSVKVTKKKAPGAEKKGSLDNGVPDGASGSTN